MRTFNDVVTASLNRPPCTCRANGCYMQHTECLCGCPRGRALCKNADECLRIIAANRDIRAEVLAKYPSGAEHGTARQTAASGETRSQEGTPAVRSLAWNDHPKDCPKACCNPAF